MSQTLINTLRFADRLKEAGFAGAQAEALARVLGDELTEQLPSKADFMALQADFKTLGAKFDALEEKFNGLEAKFDGLRFTLKYRAGAGWAARSARANRAGVEAVWLLKLRRLGESDAPLTWGDSSVLPQSY